MAQKYPAVTPGGRLNKRLEFQSLGGTPNAGGELTTWTTYATLWGSIDVLRGQLLYNTGEFIEQSTYNLVIRFNPTVNISVADRIVCEGTTFIIEAILDKDFRHRELQLLCYVLNESAA
ncbi:MAG: phage head closure protein [Terracidiphilus sp.]|jgi:SPP1 family predicted phage head-tail adaptor